MIKISTEFERSEIPIIRLKFPGIDKEYYAMIDSGSAITMFNEKLIDVVKHETDSDCSISVTGINGKKSSDSSWIKLDCSATDSGGSQVYLSFDAVTFSMDEINRYYCENYNADVPFALIIGSDVLTLLKARVNYEDKTLDINDEKE